MKHIFTAFSLVFIIMATLLMGRSKSAIHEIEAILLLMIGVQCFATAAVLRSHQMLEAARSTNKGSA